MNVESSVPLLPHEVTGQGEPLVLMPGGLTGWRSWTRHAEVLAASRRVIRLQLHTVEIGLAGEPLPADYSIGWEASALQRTLDELDIQQADFAAWSYGAAVTLSFAIHNPHRVRSLTMIEPPAYWVLRRYGPWPAATRAERAFLQTLAVDDISEEQLVMFTHTAGIVPEGVDPRSLPQWPVWVEHRQSLRFGDAVFRHEDSMDLVRAFDKPVLLVKGEGSTTLMHDIIDVLAEELPDARVVTLPGAHAAHIVSMEPFMERFTRFLAEASEA